MKREISLAAALLSVSVVALGLGSAAQGTTASRSLIAIHEQGTDNPNAQSTTGATRGKFTIELQKALCARSGRS